MMKDVKSYRKRRKSKEVTKDIFEVMVKDYSKGTMKDFSSGHNGQKSNEVMKDILK